MNISIITIGKLKEKYLKAGIDEYLKRLSSYAKVEVIEMPDEKAPEELSPAEMEQVKHKEGEKLLSKIYPGYICNCTSNRWKNEVIRRISRFP